MALTTIWVLAEAAEGKPLPVSLELMTKARDLAGTVEAVTWGADAATYAPTLAAYGAARVHDVGDLGGAPPGGPGGGAGAGPGRGGGPPAAPIPPPHDS